MFMFFGKNKLKEWAENNQLKYQKEVKLGFIRAENISLIDLVWGEYNNKRIYIFTVSDNTGQHAQKCIFLNGNYYSTSKIEPENIDKLLEDENYLEKTPSIFGGDSRTEVIQTLVAQMFLQTGRDIGYQTIEKIYKLFWKFYNSRTSFKEKVIGKIAGDIKADVKFNSPEAIKFVEEKIEKQIEKNLIEEVANIYESLLNIYNKDDAPPKNPLEDINLSKFN